MSVYTHEIFGHVLSVLRVATYEEGLALINRNELANGTAIFTRDGGAAPAVPARRRGQHGGRQRAYYSFGGWKSSLFGDTHAHGVEGVHFFTRGKVVTSRWPDPATSAVDLGFPRTR